MKRRTWVLILVGLGLLFAAQQFVLVIPVIDPGAKRNRVLADIESLLRACELYRERPASGGKYPATLDDVTEYLDQGKSATIDPWGNRYQYAVVSDGDGKEQPFVWTEPPPHTVS